MAKKKKKKSKTIKRHVSIESIWNISMKAQNAVDYPTRAPFLYCSSAFPLWLILHSFNFTGNKIEINNTCMHIICILGGMTNIIRSEVTKTQMELVFENSKLCSESLVTGFSWAAPTTPAELWTLMKCQHRDRKSTWLKAMRHRRGRGKCVS